MKTKKHHSSIKLATLMFSLILSTVFISCDSNDVQDKPRLQDNYEVTEGDYTFFANPEKYDEADLKRGQDHFCQVETKISKVKRNGNMLTIEILKPKNCEVKYEIIWNGEVLYSDPMQSAIYVRALADGCNDGAEKEIDALVIKLEETLKNLDKNIIDKINFTVRDACSLVNIDCVEDCNVVTTF